MRIRLLSALLALAGCAASPQHRSDDYDHLLGELRRDERARPSADTALAAITSAKALERAALVQAVIARNPGVAAMREAWRAAVAEIPAAGALADPMLSYELAPLSIGNPDVRFGQRVELKQKLPFPGKRGLASDLAVAEAEVAHADWTTTALDLAQAASSLYDDYALVAESLEVNEHHHALLQRMKQASDAQLAAGRGSTQDSLAAEVELGKLEAEHVRLDTERATVVARLDGLLHRDPEAPLPPPVTEPALTIEPPALAELVRDASIRPDVAVANERARASQTRVDLAERAFYPDFEVMGSYDSMWPMTAHQWMIGFGLDLPIQRGKRHAELDAARARVTAANEAIARVQDDIRVDVFRARRDVVESIAVVKVFDTRIVPAAQGQVDAALSGFITGRNDFTAVLVAERSLRDQELGALRARADLSKRRAALDRALGRLPGGGAP